jgi:hypothetical protein
MANSYFMEDKDLEDLAKKVVSELYNNKNIVNLTNNGKLLIGQLKSLTDRNISGIYSNIKNHKSLQPLLINGIRYSIFVEKDINAEKEVIQYKNVLERRNILYENKKKQEINEETNQELEKMKLEIDIIQNKIKELETKNIEPPSFRKNILEISQKSYRLLLRNDKTSEKLYTFICNKLGVKLDNDHFGYYQSNYNSYQSNYQSEYKSNYQKQEKKDLYVPPALQYRQNKY